MIGKIRSTVFLAVSVFLASSQVAAQTSAGAIRIEVDSTRAPQKILHAHLEIPVQPGPLVLYYPEWIPGEHQPTGPVVNTAGLKFTVNGKMLPWRRDLVDMGAYHIDVPPGAASLAADFDYLLSAPASGYSSGASATAFLNMVSWNQVVLYPKGRSAADITFVASLKLPPGWKFGTALRVAKQDGDTVEFAPVSLEELIDSPVLSGRYFRVIDLSPGQMPDQEMDIAADSAAALDMPQQTQEAYRQLIVQAGKLFGTKHYRDYHFLVTLSDYTAHFGLEHHESSDDRTYERSLVDPTTRTATSSLMPHEYVHSWNGKYRRPAGLLSPDYHQPMQDDLLWVYEGLTNYLGEVLATRSGLWAQQQAREELATTASLLDVEPGRQWRPLQDTADAAVFLYDAKSDWQSWRRGTDYYQEGIYLWLGVDDTIRKLTREQKSINDFARLFDGGTGNMPDLKSYSFDDVVTALDEVAPYDWAAYLRTRLDSFAPNTMDESLANGGWKIAYTDQPNEIQDDRDKVRKELNLMTTLGMRISTDGTIVDVLYDGPAYKAGLGPAMKITAVNGREVSAATIAETIKDAIKAAQNGTSPIQLIAVNGSDVQVHPLDYHGGLRYPHLIRDESQPDRLSEILKPLP
jgi:predicted metalloprotease with PDZ domain